jgi:hypothetical protein
MQSNEFVREFGGKEDLFINTIRKNPRGINEGSSDNVNCKYCINCINCKNCLFCKNCINCVNCSYCENCVDCKYKIHKTNLIFTDNK